MHVIKQETGVPDKRCEVAAGMWGSLGRPSMGHISSERKRCIALVQGGWGKEYTVVPGLLGTQPLWVYNKPQLPPSPLQVAMLQDTPTAGSKARELQEAQRGFLWDHGSEAVRKMNCSAGSSPVPDWSSSMARKVSWHIVTTYGASCSPWAAVLSKV